jgi:hypothetical protein
MNKLFLKEPLRKAKSVVEGAAASFGLPMPVFGKLKNTAGTLATDS